MKSLSLKEAKRYGYQGRTPLPVQEKRLKMADGVELSVKTLLLSDGRITVFFVADADFVADSVLFEVFLSVGGAVCAVSAGDFGYKIKLFTPT